MTNTHSVVIKFTTHRVVRDFDASADLAAYLQDSESFGDEVRDVACTYDCAAPGVHF